MIKNIMENNSFTSTNENQVMEQTTPSIIATELVLEKLKAANINVITDQNEMQAVLDAGIEVQKMAAHYGTNQNIENAESFNGYGVYVLSVNEENARNFGLKIAAKKYGNSFYINNQPLQELPCKGIINFTGPSSFNAHSTTGRALSGYGNDANSLWKEPA